MNKTVSKTLNTIVAVADAWVWAENILFVLIILGLVGCALLTAWGR